MENGNIEDTIATIRETERMLAEAERNRADLSSALSDLEKHTPEISAVFAEAKKLEAELMATAQAKEIISEVAKQRSLEAGKEYNKQEEIPDYIGKAGKKARELVETGKQKGRDWISRVRQAINKGIHTTIQTAPKVAKAVKEAPGKIDSKIQEAQMAHARDKFEKRKNRKTFSSKKEDLVNVIKFKIKEWKDKGKESFADNLAISKAYIGVAKDKVVQTAKDAAFYTQYGAHNVKDAVKTAKDNTVFYAQYGAHNVKEGAKHAKDKVVQTAKDAAFYTQYGAHNIKEGIKNAEDRVIKGAKGFIEKVDKKIQHAQMQSAMRKIKYKGKAKELFSAIKSKITEWKDKGKESFAKNLEISKAYASVAKDYIKDGKDKLVKNAKQLGTEAKVLGAYGKVVADEKIDKATNAISSAAVATGTAAVGTKNKVKRNVKNTSKRYTGAILSKMANGLEKAINSAGKLHESLKTRSNQLLETPNIQKNEDKEQNEQSNDEVK